MPLRAFISSAKSWRYVFCLPVAAGHSLRDAFGEHRYCLCGIRQRFKVVRMCQHIHTALPQVDSDCCMLRSTHALLQYHSTSCLSAPHSNKNCPFRPPSPCHPSLRPYPLHESNFTAHRAQIRQTHICCEVNHID